MRVSVRHVLFCLILLFAMVEPRPSPAQTVVAVATSDDLSAMVAQAEPGTVFELQPGIHPPLILRGISGTREKPVVIRSRYRAQRAVIPRMDLREVSHIVLEGLAFDYVFAPEDPANFRPFQVFTARDLTIRDALFDGDIAAVGDPVEPGYPTGFGLAIRASAEVLVEGSEIRDFYRGLVVSDAVDIVVRGNDLHSIRMDGMNFAQVERVRIEGNTIRDFKRVLRSSDHADMIQFWTNRTERPSRDIVIRDNVLNSGLGWYTQSIFMRNEEVDTGRAGDAMFYRNVTIEENVIVNAHLHGITVGETEGLIIRNNTMVYNDRSTDQGRGRAVWRPRINVATASRDVTIERNVAHGMPTQTEHPGWMIRENLTVQDRTPSAPDHLDAVFLAARSGDPRVLSSFGYRPDGPLGEGRIGASRLRGGALPTVPQDAPPPAAPAILVLPDGERAMTFRFDAETGIGLANLSARVTAISWDLGDGTTASGGTVDHIYANPGDYRVVLRVTLDDGGILESTADVYAQPQEILRYDPLAGEVVSFVKPVAQSMAVHNGAGRIPVGGEHPVIQIPNTLFEPFFGSDKFTLTLRFRSDKGYRGAGELLLIHQVLRITVLGRGLLEVRFNTPEASEAKFLTRQIPAFSGEWVDLTIRYNAGRKRIEVLSDGRLIGSGFSQGRIARPMHWGHWGIALGNPFNTRKTFEGEIGGLTLSTLAP